VNSAWKNEQLLKVQFRKAASVCRDRLNLESRNVQSVKTAPSSVLSERSRPMKATRVCSCPEGPTGHPQPLSTRLATRAATITGS
jgi:hypothetical protein